MDLDVSTGRVLAVHKGGQAERAGVELGWFVQEIDWRPYNEELLQQMTEAVCDYTVSFRPPYDGPDDVIVSAMTLVDITVKPGSLGVHLDFSTGVVEDVHAGGQADIAGVQSGWVIRSIDEQPYIEELLVQKRDGPLDYTLSFRKVPYIGQNAVVGGDWEDDLKQLKYGARGKITNINLTNNTVKIGEDIGWLPINVLIGYENWSPPQAAPDTTAVSRTFQEDLTALSIEVENLSAEALQKACDRNTHGAMDIYEQVNTMIDLIARLRHQTSGKKKWAESQIFKLCAKGEEHMFQRRAVLLDQASIDSVSNAVAQLNAIDGERALGVQESDGVCVAYSRRGAAYFVIYRNDRTSHAHKLFDRWLDQC